MLSKIEQRLESLALVIALVASACLLVVALATMADVLLRWLFKAPIHGLNDMSALVTAVVVAGCFPMLLTRRGNVTIRLLGSWLGPRTSRVLDSFGALVTAVFFALMTWQYIRYSAEMTQANEATPILRWPVGPWWWVVTALITITTIAALIVLARELRGRLAADSEQS
jgi:TRAP-type transport system small permease protein